MIIFRQGGEPTFPHVFIIVVYAVITTGKGQTKRRFTINFYCSSNREQGGEVGYHVPCLIIVRVIATTAAAADRRF